MSDEDNEDSFAAMFEKTARPAAKRRGLRVGDRLDAVVVQVGRDTVFVELDGKRTENDRTFAGANPGPVSGATISYFTSIS